MIHSPLTESYAFLSLFISGGLCAVFYLILSVVRKKQHGRILPHIYDAVFGAATVLLLIHTLDNVAYGKARLYHIAGFILGFIFYKTVFLRLYRLCSKSRQGKITQ